jgi:hypothetical protein
METIKEARSAMDENKPYVMRWNFQSESSISLVVTGGNPYSGQPLKPESGQCINAGATYNYLLFNTLNIDIHSNFDGKGDTFRSTTIKMVTDNNDNTYPLDDSQILAFAYDASKSHYSGDPLKDTWNYFNVTAPGLRPLVITNDGWSNGQGNSDPGPTAGQSFWVQDSGMDPKRWMPDGGAIYQSTAELSGSNDGRAYPIHLDEGEPTWKPSGGVGAAREGLWQIDIKIGSDGTQNSGFCETFYLAERTNLYWGAGNYSDGNGGGGRNVYTREIDILETYWTNGSAQINLPDNVHDRTPPFSHTLTGWNTEYNPAAPPGINLSDLRWSNVGGAPTKDFLTFGCLIRGDNLWLYAYKADNTQWYCTTAIPKSNSKYVQNGDFVPYIGTWRYPGAPSHKPGFKTGYKNFIYLPANNPMIANKNPKDNPEAFGKTLLRLLYVVNYGAAEITRVVVPEKGKNKSGPSLKIGPQRFVEVSPGQVAGDLPWYLGRDANDRPTASKVESLPAVISFDSIEGVNCLTAVVTAAPLRLTGQNVHVVNYYGHKLTGLFVLPATGEKGFPLEIGPRSFVRVTTQQVPGKRPWYVTDDTKTRLASHEIQTLPAIFSFAPLTGVPSPWLTAVAYPAK